MTVERLTVIAPSYTPCANCFVGRCGTRAGPACRRRAQHCSRGSQSTKGNRHSRHVTPDACDCSHPAKAAVRAARRIKPIDILLAEEKSPHQSRVRDRSRRLHSTARRSGSSTSVVGRIRRQRERARAARTELAGAAVRFTLSEGRRCSRRACSLIALADGRKSACDAGRHLHRRTLGLLPQRGDRHLADRASGVGAAPSGNDARRVTPHDRLKPVSQSTPMCHALGFPCLHPERKVPGDTVESAYIFSDRYRWRSP